MKIEIVLNDVQRRLLLAFVILAALVLYVWLLHLILSPRDYASFTAEEQAYIARRMKYHGTKEATCAGTACWFYRDGKKIRL